VAKVYYEEGPCGIVKEIDGGSGQNAAGETNSFNVQTASKMTFRDWIGLGSIILSYILWVSVLVMIKRQSDHNCDWAFPGGAIPLTFIIVILAFVVFFSSMKKRRHEFLSLTFLILYLFLFIPFILYISVAGMCWCTDPETITKTYIVFSLIFAGDIGIKGAMFNGLM